MTKPARLPSRRLMLAMLLAASGLTGCDWLGLESATATASRREAEGKAIGGACRHAGRAIEDCYLLNKRADKAAIFTGWREMNDYMRENQMEAIKPLLSGTGVARPGSADKVETETLPPTTGAGGNKGGKDS
jgi:hypothetical protein